MTRIVLKFISIAVLVVFLTIAASLGLALIGYVAP